MPPRADSALWTPSLAWTTRLRTGPTESYCECETHVGCKGSFWPGCVRRGGTAAFSFAFLRSFSGCVASGAVANTAQDQGACIRESWAEFDFYQEYIAVLPQGNEFERNIRTSRAANCGGPSFIAYVTKFRKVFDTRL